MDPESIFISTLWAGCLILIGISWTSFIIFTYKPNNSKTARKLLSFIGQQKQFTIQPKNPYKSSTTFNIKILGFRDSNQIQIMNTM